MHLAHGHNHIYELTHTVFRIEIGRRILATHEIASARYISSFRAACGLVATMPPDTPVTAIAQVIQLAVAPVFLLTGVGAILSVLTNRLARIVDRARALENEFVKTATDECLRRDLAMLSRRARLVNRAISLCTVCAFLVSMVIVVLFLEAFLALNMPATIAVLFIAAMLALIAGMLIFLREIHLATASLRIGPHVKQD